MENPEQDELILPADSIKMKEYKKNESWKPLLRQCMICVGVWCTYLMQGLYLGAPTVLVAQIRREVNSTVVVTDEMLSWITSIPVISAIPFIITLPWLFNKIGRKRCFAVMWFFLVIGIIVFYMSTSLYHILISEIFMGASTGAIVTITPVIIAEYTSPKYRGIFLTLKSATTFWGIWIANAIGTFFHWKNIALVSILCPIYVITVFIWPESPYWLARKGRYEESTKSQRWLKGYNKNSEKELMQFINSTEDDSDLIRTNKRFSNFSGIWSMITSRPFYKPTLICMLLHAQYQYSGKVMISMYAIQVLKQLVLEESIVYRQMLILDGITVLSMYVGCVLSRYFRRRTLMLVFGCTGISLLYILSFYVYIVHLGILKENHVILLFLLCAFSVAVGCGPMILSTSIVGEIIPLRYQQTSLFLSGIAAVLSMSLLLKISPFMFRNLNMHGCFLFFGISSTIFLVFLYFHLPETKDKTMKEIEKYFIDTKQSEKLSGTQ